MDKNSLFSDFKEDKVQKLKIEFNPIRQVLHKSYDFQIIVKLFDDASDNDEIKIYYNNQDVTERYLKLASKELLNNNRTVKFTFKDLRLKAEINHRIVVSYKHHKTQSTQTVEYQPPYCDFQKQKEVQHTGLFRPSERYLDEIEEISKERSINPSLLTGLIAQESSFNKNALSWSKALGLTQVTPLAEREITSIYKDWPRNKMATESSVPMIKALITLGKINSKNEWRLNPNLSIQGGRPTLIILEVIGKNQKINLF